MTRNEKIDIIATDLGHHSLAFQVGYLIEVLRQALPEAELELMVSNIQRRTGEGQGILKLEGMANA